jgi:hypothetical protein
MIRDELMRSKSRKTIERRSARMRQLCRTDRLVRQNRLGLHDANA